MPSPPAIRAVGVEKAFGRVRAVHAADLTVAAGSLVALLGPSGSGKTTLLRLIAGFEVPDAGTVEIGGAAVAGPGAWVEPEARNVGMVFQDGALFPHLTVAKNVAFGATAAGRVDECLELVGLAHRRNAYPHELSGGERQRIALARALATDPAVVLLDEPFAALDTGLRLTLREEVAAILRAAGASALLVTHDQQEALSLADEVVVMRDGCVVQHGPPEEVYLRPRTRWLAEFLGAAVVLDGVAQDGGVDTELGRLPLAADARGAVSVMLRPESIVLRSPDTGSGTGTHPVATVTGRRFYGHDQVLTVALPSGRAVESRAPGTAPWRTGDDVRVCIEAPVHVLDADEGTPEDDADRLDATRG